MQIIVFFNEVQRGTRNYPIWLSLKILDRLYPILVYGVYGDVQFLSGSDHQHLLHSIEFEIRCDKNKLYIFSCLAGYVHFYYNFSVQLVLFGMFRQLSRCSFMILFPSVIGCSGHRFLFLCCLSV